MQQHRTRRCSSGPETQAPAGLCTRVAMAPLCLFIVAGAPRPNGRQHDKKPPHPRESTSFVLRQLLRRLSNVGATPRGDYAYCFDAFLRVVHAAAWLLGLFLGWDGGWGRMEGPHYMQGPRYANQIGHGGAHPQAFPNLTSCLSSPLCRFTRSHPCFRFSESFHGSCVHWIYMQI